MDSLALDALARELTPALLGQTIQKVRLGADGGPTLSLRLRSRGILVITLLPHAPLCFLTDENLVFQSQSSLQQAALKKYLVGCRISGIRKELSDRRLFLELETRRSPDSPPKIILILELIPSRPDIVITGECGQLLFSLRMSHDRFQPSPDFVSTFQPKSALKPEELSADDLAVMLKESQVDVGMRPGRKHIRHKGLSISPILLAEIAEAGGSDPSNYRLRLTELIERVRSGPYSPRLYELMDHPDGSILSDSATPAAAFNKVNIWILTPFPFRSLERYTSIPSNSMNEACRRLFLLVQERKEFLDRKQALHSSIQAFLKRKARLLENLTRDLQKSRSQGAYKKYADLMYAQANRTPPGISLLRTKDLFEPDHSEIEIPLDPRLSLIQNANRYSRMFQKSNRSLPQILKRMEALEAEVAALHNLEVELAATRTLEQVEEIALARAGPLEAISRGERASADPPSSRESRLAVDSESLVRKVARMYISSEGLTILVGKSSRDNDILTRRIARADDFWLHVAGYGGSHVVLRNPGKLTDPPNQSLLEAARLAGYFSQARNSPKVEVHYTQKKFVTKPKGSKAGLMRLKEYRSITVQPGLL